MAGFQKPIHINVTGHSRGGVTASETVIRICDWLNEQPEYKDFAKKVQFDLILLDPVPGSDVTDSRRRNPDFRKYPNVNVTSYYRGSGISELPDGVYLSDEKRNLIRVTRYSQVDQIINLVNQSSLKYSKRKERE
ncbi:MAG: hypothetical protein IKQ91_04625 [Oscillospiraceae bacterium]|nr:hypothetical protein [Oscillospiraceae bacterium]